MLNHDSCRFADPDYQPERFFEQPAYDDFPDYQEELLAEQRTLEAIRNEAVAILSMIPSLRKV